VTQYHLRRSQLNIAYNVSLLINTYYARIVAVSLINGTYDYQLTPRKLYKVVCKPVEPRLEIDHTRKYIDELFIFIYEYHI